MKRNHANLPLSVLVLFTAMTTNIQAADGSESGTLEAPKTIFSMEKMEEENRHIPTHSTPMATTVRNLKMITDDPCCCLKGTAKERLYTYVANQELTYNGKKINDIQGGQIMKAEYLDLQKDNITEYLDSRGNVTAVYAAGLCVGLSVLNSAGLAGLCATVGPKMTASILIPTTCGGTLCLFNCLINDFQ